MSSKKWEGRYHRRFWLPITLWGEMASRKNAPKMCENPIEICMSDVSVTKGTQPPALPETAPFRCILENTEETRKYFLFFYETSSSSLRGPQARGNPDGGKIHR
jgi:hypothetical protein